VTVFVGCLFGMSYILRLNGESYFICLKASDLSDLTHTLSLSLSLLLLVLLSKKKPEKQIQHGREGGRERPAEGFRNMVSVEGMFGQIFRTNISARKGKKICQIVQLKIF
jgi:hypothetical protein